MTEMLQRAMRRRYDPGPFMTSRQWARVMRTSRGDRPVRPAYHWRARVLMRRRKPSRLPKSSDDIERSTVMRTANARPSVRSAGVRSRRMDDHERYFPDRCIECPALLSEMTAGDRCAECMERARIEDEDRAMWLQWLVAG